ncbi:MAG: hypothetical protein NTV21_19310 [Planctomycetota bacterium]|nr:hypothetical protein [Planctomycetota bacterium]
MSIATCMLPVESITIATSSPASRRSKARSTNAPALLRPSGSAPGGGSQAVGA